MAEGALPTGPVQVYRRHAHHLHVCRLEVTQEDWDAGLHLCASVGVDPIEARRAVYAFLYRLTPLWRVINGWMDAEPLPPLEQFPGWDRLRAELQQECRGMDTAERWHFLQIAFGSEAVRVALVLLST